MLWMIGLILTIGTSYAQVGSVLKVLGTGESTVTREKLTSRLTINQKLKVGDEISSGNNGLVLRLATPIQLKLTPKSQITITSGSEISFKKGSVRSVVSKAPFKIQGPEVAFTVHGTNFEVLLDKNRDVILNVFEGEVEASSPHVQTFVPEMVKANEQFIFVFKDKNFVRKKKKQAGISPDLLDLDSFTSD